MFADPAFWLIVAVAFAALQFVPAAAVQMRGALLALTGVAGIVLVFRLPPTAMAVLVLAIALVVVGTRRLLARGPHDRYGLALMIVAPIAMVWAVGKSAAALEIGRLMPLAIVGLSYLLVKVWTLLKDIADGKVEAVEPAVLVAYLVHMPTFLAGPMHYYGEFRRTVAEPAKLSGEVVADCAFRFALGLVKVNVLAALLAPASLTGLLQQETIGATDLLIGAFVFSLVLYCDFSGYCDMATAVSRLLGVSVPENFDWPYAATSIREFWRRWHITFTRALTAHVFLPLSRALQRRLPDSPDLARAGAYLGTFLFCGYWHGATPNFLLWGLYHAAGLIVQDRWERYRRKPGPRPAARKSVLSRAAGIAMTFVFVSVGWIFFVLPLGKIAAVRLP